MTLFRFIRYCSGHSRILFPLLLVAGLTILAGSAEARIIDRLVAIAGSRPISLRELQQAIIVECSLNDFRNLPEDEKRKIAKQKLNGLISTRLIAEKAAGIGLEVSDQEVSDTIKRVLKQNHMTEANLKQILAKQGLDFSSYRDKIANDMLKSRYISKEIKANIIITNQEIMDYAGKHNLFSQEKSVTIAQIFIPKNSPNAVGGKDNKIWKTIRKRLDNEENFFALASEYSEGPAAPKGGRLGTFKKGNLREEIEDVAYKLPLGETSEVIETDLGYHMIVVTNRTGGEEKSLTPKAEDEIKGKLYNQKLKAAIKKLGQDLRREYKVKSLVRNPADLI